MHTPAEKLRPWLIRWMHSVVAGHLLVGLLLPWIADLPLVEAYHRYIEQQFGGHYANGSARSLQVWWISLFGPTVAGMSIWMGALVYFGARYRSSLAWAALILGTLLWAPQDIWISLWHTAWWHVWLDSFALLTMLPPLLYLCWHDHQFPHGASAALAAPERIHFSPQPERVLVLGATGFIGQQLVRALLADGQQVTIFVRNAKAAAAQFDGQVRCVTNFADLRDEEAFDVVINLAGAPIVGPRWSAARQALLRASRIGVTENLLSFLQRAKHKPRLLLNASAIGYYGIQAQGDEQALHENSPPQDIFMSQLCREWESSAQQACQLGIPLAVMRFGVVLGQQGALPKMLLPIKLGVGGPLAGGQQWLSWIHLADLLRGIAFLTQQRQWTNTLHAYNFTAPQAVKQRDFAQTAASIWHRPSFMTTPGWTMRWLLGEQADLLLEGQRVAPQRLLAEGFAFRYPDLRTALLSIQKAEQYAHPNVR